MALSRMQMPSKSTSENGRQGRCVYKTRQASRNEVSLSKTPLEILDDIISYLDFLSMKSFGDTSRCHRNLVNTHRFRAVKAIVGDFVPDVDTFLVLLDGTDSVISGSAALVALMPGAFIPQDLDVYVPQKNLTSFTRCLRLQFGFRPSRPSIKPGQPTPGYGDSSLAWIDEILWFERNKMNINIMSVRGDNAIVPIFSFHTTAVMNFITPRGIYCAYPRLTLSCRSLINSTQHTHTLDNVLKKYQERGMDSSHDLSNWIEFDGHRCALDRTCPQTVRGLYDTGGLFVPFPQQYEDEVFDGVSYTYEKSVIWSLQCGQSCVGIRPITSGFVHSVPLEVL